MKKSAVKKQNQEKTSNNNEYKCTSSITNDQIYIIKRLKLFLVKIVKLTKNEQDRELILNKIEEFLVLK